VPTQTMQSIFAALLLVGLVPAQQTDATPLAIKLAQKWDTNLAREWAKQGTGGELLAALRNDSPLLQEPTFASLIPILRDHQDKLIAAWLATPELRASSRRLLAGLDINWLAVHYRADKSQHAAIELAAREGTIRVKSWVDAIGGRIDLHARAVVTANAQAQGGRLHPSLDAFCAGSVPCQRPVCSPFAYGQYIRDPRPHVRAAAARLLRDWLGEHKIPKTTVRALANHPNPELRRSAATARLSEDQFARALQQPTAESMLRIIRADLGGISPPRRRTAANQLFRAAIAADNDRASALFDAAIHCDREAMKWIMALAGNTNQIAIQTRALLAAQRVLHSLPLSPHPCLPEGLGPLAERLLTSESASNRLAAARILDRVISDRPITDYEGSLVRSALSYLADDAVAKVLALGRPTLFDYCESRVIADPIYSMTGDTRAQIVLTAARLGEAELIEPLLARLPTSPGNTRRLFFVRCLSRLANHTTAEQAGRVSKIVASFQSSRDTRDLITRLLGKHPAHVLPHLASLADSQEEWFWATLVNMRHELPRAPLAALIAKYRPTRGRSAAILATDADRMKRLFDGSETDRRLAEAAIDAMLQADHVTTEEIEALPQTLIRDAVTRNSQTSLPLTTIAALRDHLGTDAADLIGRSRPCKDPSYLIRVLSETDDEQGKLAVAKLANRSPGTPIPRPLLEALLQSADPQVCQQAMRFAFREEVAPEHWQDALQHCHKGTQAAARTLFGGAALPGDTASLHAAFTSGSAPLLRAALRRVGQLPPSEHYHRRSVVRLTTHTDASVRREAYAVLATRDRKLWPSAWLAYEAALDHDATVRATAPDAPTAK